MKLIIQIPCYNEELGLPRTLAALPTTIDGIDIIETLVISDGSNDDTVRIAREHGVDHVVDLPFHKGLAYAWTVGIDTALKAGADIIVNTDGDNQYCGTDIGKLVRPILEGEAEIVIGARPIDAMEHFSWLKKRLQRLGSWVVSRCAGVNVEDAASGFRAYTREAAFALHIRGDYSHCLETILRAARKGLTIKSVPIRVNRKLRESRLMRNTLEYLARQAKIVFRTATTLHSLKVFGIASLLFVLPGLAGFVRFLVFWFSGNGGGHVQSLIFSAALVTIGFILGMIGLVADMISGNQQLIEEALSRLKKLEVEAAASGQTRSADDEVASASNLARDASDS